MAFLINKPCLFHPINAISLRSLIIAEFHLQMTVTILTNNQSFNRAQQSTASVRDDGGPFASQQ